MFALSYTHLHIHGTGTLLVLISVAGLAAVLVPAADRSGKLAGAGAGVASRRCLSWVA